MTCTLSPECSVMDKAECSSEDKLTALRCRKCRRCLLDASFLLPVGAVPSGDPATACNVWHVNLDVLPTWIQTAVHQAQWTAGKLSCPHCGARLGGFNFVHCSKCPCGHETTVHLSKSRVDREVKPSPSHSRPARTRAVSEPELAAALPHLRCPGRRPPRGGPGPFRETLRPCQAELHSTALSSSFCSLYCLSCFVDPSLRSPMDRRDGETLVEGSRSPALSEPSNPHHPRATGDTGMENGPSQSEERSVLPGQPPQDSPLAVRRRRSSPARSSSPTSPASDQRLSKKERNRLKSLRRKQRKRERWMASQLGERDFGTGLSSGEDEEGEGYTCAVCLDVYFSPYVCQPCHHVFCEPCLRTLAKNRPTGTPCPLCRTLISHVLFQKELNQIVQTHFPREYLSRKQTFQKVNYSKWPLPRGTKNFPVIWWFQRQAGHGRWWPSPHRMLGLDALELVHVRGWYFNVDIVFYVYFILAFHIFCFLGYCFFLLLTEAPTP
uniref:E3 ubiquitin-protein ligase RNF180 n=1 Tax=Denticeps clupeoides TaxID=299321 RepID=A0AAY4B1L7_9TELE